MSWLLRNLVKTIFYSELNLNQYSVGLPCRTICTVCGSPPCPDLNLIHYIYQSWNGFSATGKISGSLRRLYFVHLCASCRRGHFLFFASPKKRKQKKGDCGHRFGFAKLPSLRTVFRAGSQLAAAPLRTCKPLFPEKPRSARLCQQTGGKLGRLVDIFLFGIYRLRKAT